MRSTLALWLVPACVLTLALPIAAEAQSTPDISAISAACKDRVQKALDNDPARKSVLSAGGMVDDTVAIGQAVCVVDSIPELVSKPTSFKWLTVAVRFCNIKLRQLFPEEENDKGDLTPKSAFLQSCEAAFSKQVQDQPWPK